MCHQFNIQTFYMVRDLHWVFRTDLRRDSDFCFIRNKSIGFDNRDEMCLQRGTDWVFK